MQIRIDVQPATRKTVVSIGIAAISKVLVEWPSTVLRVPFRCSATLFLSCFFINFCSLSSCCMHFWCTSLLLCRVREIQQSAERRAQSAERRARRHSRSRCRSASRVSHRPRDSAVALLAALLAAPPLLPSCPPLLLFNCPPCIFLWYPFCSPVRCAFKQVAQMTTVLSYSYSY